MTSDPIIPTPAMDDVPFTAEELEDLDLEELESVAYIQFNDYNDSDGNFLQRKGTSVIVVSDGDIGRLKFIINWSCRRGPNNRPMLERQLIETEPMFGKEDEARILHVLETGIAIYELPTEEELRAHG